MSDVAPAFYLPRGSGRYEPTRATESPWDHAAQHGGPPSALLAEAIDASVPGAADGTLRLARISLDFLGPIPRREAEVEVSPVKPGRRVHLTDARMLVDGRPVVLARAWHIATGPQPPVPGATPPETAALPPAAEQRYFAGQDDWGYGQATEWRFVTGDFDSLGPADVWTRVRVPLVDGQPLRGLHRALIVADSANGLSAELPLAQWFSIPPTMSTTLLRHPEGEWVNLAGSTRFSPDGLGFARADLADATGWFGEVGQPLLVAAR
ncbi:thioesterase family protein [Jatrophihabitans sp. YIM 134969]